MISNFIMIIFFETASHRTSFMWFYW